MQPFITAKAFVMFFTLPFSSSVCVRVVRRDCLRFPFLIICVNRSAAIDQPGNKNTPRLQLFYCLASLPRRSGEFGGGLRFPDLSRIKINLFRKNKSLFVKAN